MIRLLDTARGEVRPLETRVDGEVSMYVCGPTVYGPPHIGHGRQAVLYDILRRYLTWCGYRVRHVSNVTDIDDKIIDRATEEGVDHSDIARTYEKVWWDAMDALGLARPDETPHATEYVDRMTSFVGDLLERGVAYETGDGIYLDVAKVESYGLLARQDLASLRSGARVEANEEKRSPLDFVLWKKAKAGEPAWPAPFGEGRPGWHTECVVMSLDLLGDGFDLHTGGEDLRFPHHENERAQAEASGHRFASHWMHHAFVEVGGEKMSKSVGNVTNLVELLDLYDPRAFRLLLLRSHYRSPVEVTHETMTDADTAVERLDAFARRTAGLASVAGATPPTEEVDAFREAMDDDLDTPAAVARLFDLVRRANVALDTGDEDVAGPLTAAVRTMAEALGLELRSETADVPSEVQEWARRRDEARASRDYSTADELRDRITGAGYVVEDTPGGTVVRPA